MKTPLTLGLAGALAMSAAAPALAQYDPAYPSGTPYRPTEQYQRDLQRYDNDRADYQARRVDYAQARRDFDRRLADYERARVDYDARYGYGAYARVYGPAPVWNSARWADAYGRDSAYVEPTIDPCRSRERGNTVAGGVIGALAGAALGSNVAARNARTEGAVLGAVVGGAVGAGIGNATAKCDAGGYYYSYNETIPYRESRWDRARRSGQYDYRYYSRMRCRLAPAPVDWGDRTDYRYVRVCPDASGRFRITG